MANKITDLRGAVGFSKYKGRGIFGWVSRAIRFFTEGPWTHTFVVFEIDKTFGPLILEAEKNSVRIRPLSVYRRKEYRFELWHPHIPKERITKALGFTSLYYGKPYGYAQAIGFAFLWAARRLRFRKVNNLFGSGVICSELVLRYLKAAGLETEQVLQLDRNSTSPQDLFKIISRSIQFQKVERLF